MVCSFSLIRSVSIVASSFGMRSSDSSWSLSFRQKKARQLNNKCSHIIWFVPWIIVFVLSFSFLFHFVVAAWSHRCIMNFWIRRWKWETHIECLIHYLDVRAMRLKLKMSENLKSMSRLSWSESDKKWHLLRSHSTQDRNFLWNFFNKKYVHFRM